MDLHLKFFSFTSKMRKLLGDSIGKYLLDFGIFCLDKKRTQKILTIKGSVDKFALKIGTCIHQKTPKKNEKANNRKGGNFYIHNPQGRGIQST